MPDHQLGDAPIEAEFRQLTNDVAVAIDRGFNGEARGKDRKVGFVLLVFPYNEPTIDDRKRCNFISNGADRRDIVALFKEMIARFEGQPEMKGNA